MKDQLIRFIAICFLSGVSAICGAQTAGLPDFELVESVPLETNLGNDDIRDTRAVWLDMINGAKRSLDFEEFYVSDKKGEALEGIIGAIKNAAARGVEVRIIVDARMYRTYPETVDTLGTMAHIARRIIDYGKLAGGVQHSKYFIVDGEEVFLGSQNFDWRALDHIHELGLRIRHRGAAALYEDIFTLDWNLAATNAAADIPALLKPQAYHVPFVVNGAAGDSIVFTPTMSPKGIIPDSTLWDETNIVNLIDGAAKEVYCQFLTYSPVNRDKSYYPVLNEALIRAAARGAKVKLIVSDWSVDRPAIEYLKKLSKIPNIELGVSAIPEYSKGYIPFGRVEHCKYIVVDGNAFWLGTSNGERGYFYALRNVGVIARYRPLAERLKKIFLHDWEGSYVTKLDAEKEYAPRRHGEE